MKASKIHCALFLAVAFIGCSKTNEKIVIPQESRPLSEIGEQADDLRERLGVDENFKPVKSKTE